MDSSNKAESVFHEQISRSEEKEQKWMLVLLYPTHYVTLNSERFFPMG